MASPDVKGAKRPATKVLIGLARSPRTATALILGLCILAAVASLFPQMPPRLEPSARLAWLEAARARYGAWSDWMARLGLFRLYRSPLFVLLGVSLGVSSAFCLVARWHIQWRRARGDWEPARVPVGAAGGRRYDLPAEADTRDLMAAFALALAGRGYRVSEFGEYPARWLYARKRSWSHLGTLATHLGITLLVLAALWSSLGAMRSTIALGLQQTAPLAPQSDYVLQNNGLTTRYGASGAVLGYELRLVTYDGRGAVREQALSATHPLSLDGYTVHLFGHWGTLGTDGVVLIIARDPGYWLFVVAGLLILLGTATTLWLPPYDLFVRSRDGEMLTRQGGKALHDRVWLDLCLSLAEVTSSAGDDLV